MSVIWNVDEAAVKDFDTGTQYVIRFEVRMNGWTCFKVTDQKREAITNPKPFPHLAARALARVLKSEVK